MLGELKESHNYAMTPQRGWEVRAKQRARVGFGLRYLEKTWVVTDVVPGSPAEAAGIGRGWIVAARDGKPLGPETNFSLKDGQAVSYDFITADEQRRTLTLVARVLSTDDYREVIVLRHLEELTFPEVAARLERTVDSVQKVWVRALAKLRQSMGEPT